MDWSIRVELAGGPLERTSDLTLLKCSESSKILLTSDIHILSVWRNRINMTLNDTES
jgi:hypothetical protein